MIDYLLNIFQMNSQHEAIVWRNHSYSYLWLSNTIETWILELQNKNIKKGSIVALQADFSPNAIALLITLAKLNCIIVPLTIKNKIKRDEYCHIAQVEYLIEIDSNDNAEFTKLDSVVDHPLLLDINAKAHSGLVIFSSGSTGKNKAAVHDLIPLLEKFKTPKRKTRVIAFLLFDHIGGLNTLFYTLFNGGCLIMIEHRTPKEVCEAIEKFNAQALTTTPTFLNLLLLSGIYREYDLKSLNVINYGTEVMPESTLLKLRNLFPTVRLSQAYGLSEVGVLPVRSKSSDSLFIKIGEDGFKTRIVAGLLEIKAESAMLGYLNAPNPFTQDGWFRTDDAVEVEGSYMRVLGRTTELINIGGEKVYPAEIENVIQNIQGVEQVSVYAEYNAITGQIVVAKIKLEQDEKISHFRERLYRYCQSYLPPYKIPRKIILTNALLHNERFKKVVIAK